jgi:hypothetical protein
MASEIYLRALRFPGATTLGSISRPTCLRGGSVDAVFAAGQCKCPAASKPVRYLAQDRVPPARMVDTGVSAHTSVAVLAQSLDAADCSRAAASGSVGSVGFEDP